MRYEGTIYMLPTPCPLAAGCREIAKILLAVLDAALAAKFHSGPTLIGAFEKFLGFFLACYGPRVQCGVF